MKAHCLVHNFVYVRQVFGRCTVVERSGFLHIDKRTKIDREDADRIMWLRCSIFFPVKNIRS